ncbi:MAG: hypothetical protein KDF24_12205 [Rhodocyclaceae bacterium]|nr:hypothetical protein [Rhodocyclaceae bacterium]MCB1963906.1 hypothetical protein [Rhodocyclaceae bacterium]
MISRFFPRLLLAWAVLAASVMGAPVVAQSLRQLPSDLILTTMVAQGASTVVLGERQVRLSPAAQVRGANNLIIQPASVYGTFRVGVKTDAQGMVHRIWILSAEEWAALRPGN